MTKAVLDNYKKSLVERISTARVLPRAIVEVGDWQPIANQCHDNVDIWCGHNPQYCVVRGWLYFDLPGLPYVKFLAHSVVRKPDGTLADITPSKASTDYPFIEAALSEAEYQKILECCANAEIYCNSSL